MCVEKIGLSALLDLTVNIIGEDVYNHTMGIQIFTLVMKKNLISSKYHEEIGYNLYLNLLTILYYTIYGI